MNLKIKVKTNISDNNNNNNNNNNNKIIIRYKLLILFDSCYLLLINDELSCKV